MQCVSRIRLKDEKNGGFRDVPCGKCYECKRNRQLDWAFRIKQEDKVSDYSLVVTFTYEEKLRPVTDNGILTLRKSDVQKFLKRLRKRFPDASIRYFGVGEYGSDPRRSHHPHYHIIFFVRGISRTDFESSLYDCWDFGFLYIDSLSPEAVTYVTKYCLKDSIYVLDPELGQPTYSMMSLRPAIGSNYLSQEQRLRIAGGYHRPYDYVEGGAKARVPRYYRDKWEGNRAYKEIYVRPHQETVQKQLQKEQLRKEEIWSKNHGGQDYTSALYTSEEQKMRNSINQQNRTSRL